MTNKLKCPFCEQELDCMGKYTDGSSKWLCNKCGLFGDKKLFDEIIRTRKDLKIARQALKDARIFASTHCIASTVKTIDKALEQIEHKEQQQTERNAK